MSNKRSEHRCLLHHEKFSNECGSVKRRNVDKLDKEREKRKWERGGGITPEFSVRRKLKDLKSNPNSLASHFPPQCFPIQQKRPLATSNEKPFPCKIPNNVVIIPNRDCSKPVPGIIRPASYWEPGALYQSRLARTSRRNQKGSQIIIEERLGIPGIHGYGEPERSEQLYPARASSCKGAGEVDGAHSSAGGENQAKIGLDGVSPIRAGDLGDVC